MTNPEDQNKPENYTIFISHRPWYQWVILVFWFVLEIIFLQAGIASFEELEPRAGVIFIALFGILLLGAIVLWIIRKQKLI
jgi:hypothetical protein